MSRWPGGNILFRATANFSRKEKPWSKRLQPCADSGALLDETSPTSMKWKCRAIADAQNSAGEQNTAVQSRAPCVVRTTRRTLVTDHMKGNCCALAAVVANDGYLHVLVLERHRRLSQLSVHFCPQVIEAVQRHAADRTSQGLQAHKRCLELAKTLLVDRVPALQDGYLRCGLEEVAEAHGTILVHRTLHTSVPSPDLIRITAPALIAVEKVFLSATATNAAFFAVEHLLLQPFIIPEVAGTAIVGTKNLATRETGSAGFLFGETTLAHDGLYLLSVDLMVLGAFIMTVATPEQLPTTWSDNLASSSVVSAPVCWRWRRYRD